MLLLGDQQNTRVVEWIAECGDKAGLMDILESLKHIQQAH